ncbi:hypothetical protein [Bacillus andreraoultii]|uniref:hypothetical protein n=1 Tax=Bacillus andreraoultii TaxID=1499685 RepID=UPI00053AD713|nr:hypothetical protein [Bacillus andreraoultii]
MRRERRNLHKTNNQTNHNRRNHSTQSQQNRLLSNSQGDIINVLVQNTFKKHNVKSNHLSEQEKERLRNIFYQLQNEVNQVLTKMNDTSKEGNDTKKGQ